MERICKPNPVPRTFVRGEDHSSATRVAAVVEQPTRKLSAETGGSTASLFGLAPQGVSHAVAAHAGPGALLPHRFTLTSTILRASIGGLFSVALSVASPRLDVIQPAARRSSDFPPPCDGDPPIRSTRVEHNREWRGLFPGAVMKFFQLNCCCLSSLERMSARRHQNASRFL